jgi:hypothetical protein
MALSADVTIDGKTKFKAKSFSVAEDATPVDPSNLAAGVGQFTIDFPEPADASTYHDKIVVLGDGSQGLTTGTVSGLSSTNGDLTVTADSRMALLAVARNANPFNGTLGNAFRYYLGLVGITTGIVIDSAIDGRAVSFPGWSGVVWDNIKQMCVAMQVETSLVSNNIVLRALRQRTAQQYRNSSIVWATDSSGLAQSVEVYYYQNTFQAAGLAYPAGGYTTDVQVITVGAGETTTVDAPINGSVSSINQPTCVSSVGPVDYSGSVYTVIGQDGTPISPTVWNAAGGKIAATINADTASLTIVVTGANLTNAPFQIAFTSTNTTIGTYPSLRITGTGVFTNRQKLTMVTGVDPTKVSNVVGATIDNPYINTVDDAARVGLWALKAYGTPKYTLTIITKGINRLGDTGSYTYPTVADFNLLMAGMTVAQFNTMFAGYTVGQFNSYMAALSQNNFTNQAFGNVAGARFRYRDSMFRISSVQSITPDLVSFTATEDTTIADFNTVWAGATIAQFNAQWAGLTMADFALAPLRRSTPLIPAGADTLAFQTTLDGGLSGALAGDYTSGGMIR